MTPEREHKFKKVIRRRQPNLAVILENVHDTHNIGAVLRSCESVGVMEVFVLYTMEELNKERIKLGGRTSAGARRWLEVHLFNDAEELFKVVRSRYDNIWATHLGEDAKDLYALDLTASVALVFGNESDGISQDVLQYCTGNFIIPQMGFVQSLNISVACAVTLFEAYRQRSLKGFYDENPVLSETEQADLYAKYLERHESKDKRRTVEDPKLAADNLAKSRSAYYTKDK